MANVSDHVALGAAHLRDADMAGLFTVFPPVCASLVMTKRSDDSVSVVYSPIWRSA